MAQSFIVLLLLIFLLFLLIYFLFPGFFQPQKQTPSAPLITNCVMTAQQRDQFLNSIVKGCTNRLRGIVRGSLINANEVKDFIESGNFRLVFISNLVPEKLVNAIQSNDSKAMNDLKLLAISGAKIAGNTTYVVIKMENGQPSPIGAPTTDFNEAFNYLQSNMQQFQNSDDSLAVFVDEDIPCPDGTDPMFPNYSPMFTNM